MGDARPADDRLPWLETPLAAKSAKKPPAARRARTPLLLLLGLFTAAAIAVMAYIAGRSIAPAPAPAPAPVAPPAIVVPLPAPVPVPHPTPAPLAIVPEAAIAPSVEPAAPAVVRPKVGPKAIRRPSVKRSRGVTIHRNTPRARALPRYKWPVPSATAPSGRVVQLGAYYNGRQTMAAWRRLRRAYPYLATLPRKVTVVRAGRARPRYYRLRIGADSAVHARAICDNLHRIGRGCTVV